MNSIKKFRFWLGHTKKMTYPHLISEVSKVIPEFTEDIIPLQYIGIEDTNRVEIYEGYIVGYKEDDTVGVIVYHQTAFKIQYYEDGDPVRHKEGDLWFQNIEKFEIENMIILGNIYQNAELLK